MYIIFNSDVYSTGYKRPHLKIDIITCVLLSCTTKHRKKIQTQQLTESLVAVAFDFSEQADYLNDTTLLNYETFLFQ